MRAVGLFKGGSKKKKRRVDTTTTLKSSSSQESLSQRDMNILAMKNNEIKIVRKPVLSFLGGTNLALSKKLSKPFKSPCLHLRTDESDALLKTKRLGMTNFRPPKKFVNSRNIQRQTNTNVKTDQVPLVDPSKRLVVYEKNDIIVEVPNILANVLREHQREGVRFLFACVAGVSIPPFSGAILADDMGLGKTLQTISLIYTLLENHIELDAFEEFKFPEMNDNKEGSSTNAKKNNQKQSKSSSSSWNNAINENESDDDIFMVDVKQKKEQKLAKKKKKKMVQNDGSNNENNDNNHSNNTIVSTTNIVSSSSSSSNSITTSAKYENGKQEHQQQQKRMSSRNLNVKHVIIICPTSLVANWMNEFNKWLGEKVQCIAADGNSQKEKLKQIRRFTKDRLNKVHALIISYETFRIYVDEFQGNGICDLLICDEAHRLKNDQTRVNQALNSLLCDKRVLLSGTPMQNDLDEFFVMSSFCMLRRNTVPFHMRNMMVPNTNNNNNNNNYNNKMQYIDETIFGTQSRFRKHFANPLLAAREPDATDSEIEIGTRRQVELAELTSKFVLRRTNELNKVHLPNKLTMVVVCPLSPLQQQLYEHLTRAENLDRENNKYSILSAITSLKKLVNHPVLLYRMILEQEQKMMTSNKQYCGDFFIGLKEIFPDSFRDPRQRRECEKAHHSGKMQLLYYMMQELSRNTNERIVLVSNYTETLDIFERLCRALNTRYVRLDGSVTVKKRQTLVDRFNDQNQNYFAFLLSSKAGGCGLNLIGGSRLVLFDPSWNPADDKQAAARIWRDVSKNFYHTYTLNVANPL